MSCVVSGMAAHSSSGEHSADGGGGVGASGRSWALRRARKDRQGDAVRSQIANIHEWTIKNSSLEQSIADIVGAADEKGSGVFGLLQAIAQDVSHIKVEVARQW